MQAGRWFGFRKGYRDLVRLFIRRDPVNRPGRVDLYEAFEGLMRDEVALRHRLQDYEGFQDDGTPILEPWQVPPIVSQHLPYLKPSGRTKMFNAVIDTMGDSGKLKDYYGLPERKDSTAKRANFELLIPILRQIRDSKTFVAGRSKPENPPTQFDALVGIVEAKQFLGILKAMNWHPDYQAVIAPTVRFYDKIVSDGALNDLVLIWPQAARQPVVRHLSGLGAAQIVTRSRRNPPRLDFVGSDAKHRDAAERIAGSSKPFPDINADALRDLRGRRGSVLLYIAADPAAGGDRKFPAMELSRHPDAGDLAILISMVAPVNATPHGRSVIEWTVRRSAEWGSAVVDLSRLTRPD